MIKDVNITVFETDIDCTSLIAILVKEMLGPVSYTHLTLPTT